uniref:DDE Tnp4 domain-containing protein n=1 Tax=Amphimedon queenslandica TaxID=400682 RepID=A0A1X7U804_AMPQE
MQQETDALLKEFEEKKKSRKLAEEIEMILHACNERKAKRMLSDEQEMDEELIESDEELIETIESDEEPIESDVEEPVAEQESHDNESQGACEWSISLSLEDELLLTLCCLRLGLRIEDLAVRFFISSTFASRILNKWIDLLYVHVKFLIKWPSHELCQQNMPMVIKEIYPLCISIIDCSEIFIEMPKKYDARCKTYSNYKSHNTAKFFVSITPFGTNSFLCQCWGGRVSDKN